MGVTNNFNIPYPEVTDFVTDGAVAMENIAEFADSALLANYISPVLINGGMEIWQRGTTSQTSTTTYNTSTSYRADRWFVLPAGASVTQEQSTTVPPNNLSRFSLKVTGATSATTVKIGQRIEAANIPQIRRRVTFAAWIYNETGASFQPELLLGTPSAADNFATVNNRLTQTLIPCANNEWTEVSFTADISGYTDLANGLQVEIQIPSGSLNANTKFVYVTQVRLTPSENVVPFQRLGVDAELARCQRYYEKSYPIETAPATNTNDGMFHVSAGTDGGSFVIMNVRFAVSKRNASYTASAFSNIGTANTWNWGRSGGSGVGTPFFDYLSTSGFRVYIGTAVAWTVAQAFGHWVVNAEL